LGFGPQDVADFVQDEFGIKIGRSNVAYYQKQYAEQIEQLHEEIAKDIEQIPFAQKKRRVAYLDRVAMKHYRRRQYSDFRATIKQIAEETGDLVQKHEITGKDGGPIVANNLTLEELKKLDVAELARLHSEKLGQPSEA
jgi:hypothetical protein